MSLNQDSFTSAQVYGRIIVSDEPKGRHIEGYVATGNTIKPGMFCSKKADGTYELWNGSADGANDRILIAKEARLWGKGIDDNYVAGDRIYMYEPLRGDLLLAVFGNSAGTADDVANQARLMIDDGTGKLIAATSEEVLFKSEEVYTDPTEDRHILVRFVG